jgi:hypothetical protein
MEIILDRKLVDKRVFPAIDIQRSGTRKEELLIPKEDLQRIFVLRRVLNPLSPVEAMELLITYLEKSRTNAEFLTNILSGHLKTGHSWTGQNRPLNSTPDDKFKVLTIPRNRYSGLAWIAAGEKSCPAVRPCSVSFHRAAVSFFFAPSS